MEDIAKRDRFVLLREIFRWDRVLGYLILFMVFASALSSPMPMFPPKAVILGLCLAWAGITVRHAYKLHLDKRWHDGRYRDLWKACVDRRTRLNDALAKLKKSKIADLQELPRSADKLLSDIYTALRRADLVYHEVSQSENRTAPPLLGGHTRFISDNQAQELFKVADRNIAEYSQQYRRVLAGVERSEAQAVVFATTLDTLRVRMLGYRLTGSSPEADTREFLNVVTEAKMQFQAIDQALEEIELTPFPETVVVSPSEKPATISNTDLTPEELRAAEAELGIAPPPHVTPTEASPPPFDRTRLAQTTPPPAPPRNQDQDDHA